MRPGLGIIPPWPALLFQSATISAPLAAQESSGAPTLGHVDTHTVACNLQPNTSSDAFVAKREYGQSFYTLFLAATTAAGVDVATVWAKNVRVTIDSVQYFADGEELDPCSNGALYQATVWRET